MEQLKMALGDGSEVALAGFALPLSVIVKCASISEMAEVWERLHTDACTSRVEILREGAVCGTYFGVKSEGAQILEDGDGGLTVHFYMRDSGGGQTELENEYAQAARILLGEEE